MIVNDEDRHFMKVAIDEARRAYEEDEVPIGAVVVSKGRIIGRGHNLTEKLNDVTAHAEMQAITAAANYLGGKYLDDCTLYVTVEPCIMCAGAIGWSQLKRIVYGAPDAKRGFSTFTSRTPFHPKSVVVSGVMEDECAEIMRSFFSRKRK
ncbi:MULTISPECIES: nucleoside deaminase [Muribaculum]|jgi:tRNA-specific adenosine deaminase|uniref:nucleoside deaminase n=1 Tax=Muribaculum TaxID=1918540 RepID=UPI000F45F065|nr:MULTISPECIES: nucleoside deaminase [Muribaculum]MCX4276751.1 nucleoside deaminase [Muribaculum sp.]ROT13614.1 nucleoside deaminase [Muribaculaceae bacterium Isolate-102 (HZI)]